MHGNKMGFPGVDCTFDNVGLMDFWWGILEAGFVFCYESFHIMEGLVIKFLQLWEISTHMEVCIYIIVNTKEFSPVAGFDGVGLDVFCINCVKNDNIIVASVRGDRETPSLVSTGC